MKNNKKMLFIFFPEEGKDYYLHGGVEKHPTDGFTVHGTIYGEPWKMRFIDYSLEEAMPLAKKKILNDAVQQSAFINRGGAS